MTKPTPILDLSDLCVTQDEALDLLGDLLPEGDKGLFDDSPKKLAKPRPKWVVDGFVIVRKVTQCSGCGLHHEETNSLILVSESLVAWDGNVLKSHKTAFPENLRHQDLDYDELDVKEEWIKLADVDFCEHCPTTKSAVLAAFSRQRNTALGKMTNRVDAAQAEAELLELIAELDKKESEL